MSLYVRLDFHTAELSGKIGMFLGEVWMRER